MMETTFRETIGEYRDIVETIEIFEIAEEEYISKLKAKLRLYDGTILWVREVRIKEVIEDYSYYWLRPNETVIIGWDNAPHHKEISSFPHHKHIGNKVELSQEKSLKEVLIFIQNFLS